MTISAINNSGAKVNYIGLDLTKEADVDELVATALREYGRVDGIIHGAGITEDCLIIDKKADSFSRVIDTKADSAFLLYRAMERLSVRWAIFFSSVGRFRNPGQADYAAANEILDVFACGAADTIDRRIAAISWGPWLNKGLTEKFDRSIFEARGYEVIRSIDGRAWFLDELSLGNPTDRSIVLGNGAWSVEDSIY